MSISGITSVVTNTGTQINYVKQGSSFLWARPATIKIQLPWAKFYSWSITRESSCEPTATTGSTAIASSTSTTLADDAVLTINGYYGDVYKLTRSARNGYTGLIANGATFETDPTFDFRDTGGTGIQLSAPTLSVYCQGEYVCAEIYNPNSCSVTVTAYCGTSQYGIYSNGFIGIGAGWDYYNSSHASTNTTVTKTVLSGKSLIGSWRTNDKGYDATYGSIYAYFTGADGTGYIKSTTTNQTGGTYHSTSSGSGSAGSGFSGFGGTLESG